MKQWLIILILMLCIPSVLAVTEVQISTDNSTWLDITETQYGGYINESNQTAYVQNLDAGTLYYFRARNETTDWTYISQRTEWVENEMSMGLLITGGIFVFFTALTMIAFAWTKSNHVKVVLGLVGSFLIMTLTRISSWFVSITNSDETNLINTLDHYYMFGIWIFRGMLIFAVFYTVIHILGIATTDHKRRKKEKEWEEH